MNARHCVYSIFTCINSNEEHTIYILQDSNLWLWEIDLSKETKLQLPSQDLYSGLFDYKVYAFSTD